MPYPNEHSARIREPEQYGDQIRRKNDEFAKGIDVIYGIKNGKTEIQAIRFAKEKWTVPAAKKWLNDHDFKPIHFEPATTTEDTASTTLGSVGGTTNGVPDSSSYIHQTKIGEKKKKVKIESVKEYLQRCLNG